MHPRPTLTPIPDRIASLPVHRGYPVPWFVAKVEGAFDFRVADEQKRVMAVKEKLCWVCGQRLGVYFCFVVGPMCGINRTSSEPPCHRECARWSAINCPFLSRPKMVRRDDNLPVEAQPAAGIGIMRNPGVTLLWITRTYRTFTVPRPGKGWLIEIGDPIDLEWFAEGRQATRVEIEHSIETGLPSLLDAANHDGPRGRQALLESVFRFRELLPAYAEGGD